MKQAVGKLRLSLFHALHLVRRPLTLGVRVAAFDGEGRLFLVRHTYVPGWYLPGGGVDPGESVAEAARRELREEGNLECEGELRLVSAHFNRAASRRDHVLFFRCEPVRQSAPRRPDLEIAESGFFAPDRLPDTATPATRRRIAELGGAEAAHPDW